MYYMHIHRNSQCRWRNWPEVFFFYSILLHKVWIEGDTLLVRYFNSVLLNRRYKNITYISTFIPASSSYMDGFPKQTALAQLHLLRVQFSGRPHRNTLYSYPSTGQALNHINKHCLVMNCLVLLGCLTSVSEEQTCTTIIVSVEW
jgi:hypothetical protein